MIIIGRIFYLLAALIATAVGGLLFEPDIGSGSSQCGIYDFPCENGECIDSEIWCDTYEDCSDGSDEKYCRNGHLFNNNPNRCPSTYFRCNSGPCIPMVGRCDGFLNCGDGSDEINCNNTSLPSKPGSHRVRTGTIAVKNFSTTSRNSPRKFEESRLQYYSNFHVVLQDSYRIKYSDFDPSDYTHQREIAEKWLLLQRKSNFGWGDETPRAITALYLSDPPKSTENNESNMLMVKQLEVELSLALARNGTKALQLTDLALYINALQASCKDPKNFYGENLVRTLRNRVNAAQRDAKFINPSVYLTLCMNNANAYEDARKLQGMFLDRNSPIARIDIQALVFLTTKCISRNTTFLTQPMYENLKKQFLDRLNPYALPGNVYEAALLAQVLQELKVDLPGLMKFILEQQQGNGSFGGILATYLVLPVLAGRSFLQLKDHCDQRFISDPAPIEVLKNLKRRKIFVQYALHYGNPPEIIQTIQMQVAEGINFLDVMRLAEEINPRYRFQLDGNRDKPIVYSIGGIPNDAEKGMFWTLHLGLNSNRGRGYKGRLSPFLGNIKELIPHVNDEYVFWMKSI